jgi:hypothetical protein
MFRRGVNELEGCVDTVKQLSTMHCSAVHSRRLGLTMSIVVVIYNIVNRIYTVPTVQNHVEY